MYKRILVLVLAMTMVLGQGVFGETDYIDLRQDLEAANGRLQTLSIEAKQGKLTVEGAKLEAKFMTLDFREIKKYGIDLSVKERSQMLYVEKMQVKQAALDYSKAAIKRQAEKEGLELDVRPLAQKLLEAEGAYDLAVAQADCDEKLYKALLAENKQGGLDPLRLLDSDYRARQSRLDMTRAKRALEDANLNLNLFMNYPLDRQVVIAREEKIDMALEGADYYLERALKHRHELVVFDKDLDMQAAIMDFYSQDALKNLKENKQAYEFAFLKHKEIQALRQGKVMAIEEELRTLLHKIKQGNHRVEALENQVRIEEGLVAGLVIQAKANHISQGDLRQGLLKLEAKKNALDTAIYNLNTLHYTLINKTYRGAIHGGDIL